VGTLAVALAAADRAARDEVAPFRAALLAGLMAGVATTADYTVALTCAALGVFLALTREARGPRLAGYVLGGALPAIVLLAYHQAAFGSPFRTAYDFPTTPGQIEFYARGWKGFEVPTLASLSVFSFGPRAGFFVYCPAALAGLAGAALVLRDATSGAVDRREAVLAIGLTLLAIGLNAARLYDVDKVQGYTFGPRYITTAIPFALLFAPRALERLGPRGRAAFLALACAIAWVGVQGAAFWPSYPPTLLDRALDDLHAGPRFIWALVASRTYGTPSPALVPLTSALAALGLAAALFLVWRRRDRLLASYGLGLGAVTLLQLLARRP
jgi:hypothetical protein